MNRILAACALVLGLGLLAEPAPAQTCPPNDAPQFVTGGSLFGFLASQWQQFFAAKVDVNGGTLCNPTVIGQINGRPSPTVTVLNNAGTQNYYFGVNQSGNNELYIGAGSSPVQGIPPDIRIDTTHAVTIGNLPFIGSLLNVNSIYSTGPLAGGDQMVSLVRESQPGAPSELLVRLIHYVGDNGRTPQSIFSLMGARGTVASPINLHSGDILGVLDFRGYDGNATANVHGFSDTAGQLLCSATEAWTTSAHGTACLIRTTPNGSISPASVIGFNQDGSASLFLTPTGTPVASLCLDTNGKIVKKTTTGPCV